MMNYKMTKKEEQKVWDELEEMGMIPKEVEVLPECCVYFGKDHHGNEMWVGVSGKKYLIQK